MIQEIEVADSKEGSLKDKNSFDSSKAPKGAGDLVDKSSEFESITKKVHCCGCDCHHTGK